VETIGKVEAILNDRLIIFSSSESLRLDEIVNVFSVIDDSKLKEMGFPEPILCPKVSDLERSRKGQERKSRQVELLET